MSAKLKGTTRYLLREQLSYLGVVYLIVLAALIGMPLISAIFNHNLTWQLLLNSLSINVGFIFGCFIFILPMLTYDNFKLLIQNGISRKTYWRARLLNIISLSFIGEAIAMAYYFFVTNPIAHRSFSAGFKYEFYGQLYGDFFGAHNLAGNLLMNFLFMWLAFIMLGLCGMAVGSIFSLLTKTVRRIVIIAVPILGLFFLGFLINWLARTSIHFNFEGLAKFLGFLVGFTGNNKVGPLNPLIATGTILIVSVIMAAIAYYFNHKLKIKNA